MTEMQKQFEEWARENLGCDLSHNGEHYNHTWAYYAWKGWQASRAAPVVKLPLFCVDGVDAAEYQDDVIKALDDAGVSYE